MLARGPTPLVCEVLRVRGRLDIGVVVTARVLLSHVGRVVVTVALVVERSYSEFAKGAMLELPAYGGSQVEDVSG